MIHRSVYKVPELRKYFQLRIYKVPELRKDLQQNQILVLKETYFA